MALHLRKVNLYAAIGTSNFDFAPFAIDLPFSKAFSVHELDRVACENRHAFFWQKRAQTNGAFYVLFRVKLLNYCLCP